MPRGNTSQWRTFRRQLCAAALCLAAWLGWPSSAAGQEKAPAEAPTPAAYVWRSDNRALFARFSFRDLVDAKIHHKLTQGLPTKILMTALVYVSGQERAVSTTYQSCTITWHVWEEMYRVELSRPNQAKGSRHWTPTLSGVLRRCGEANDLLIADSGQLSPRTAVFLDVTVRINPISDELLSKLKRWVSRPSRTTTVSPGSSLFSTFTGLFMQRIGDAERTLHFVTESRVPQ